jgi:hypothetical protein
VRVLNLGLRTTQQTTLFVKLPAADSTAILRIGTADRFATVAFHGDTASTTLPANDYVVALDSALVPSSSAPFTVTTDVDAIYMTAGALDSDVGPLVVGTGRAIIMKDPKDPNPPSIAAAGTAAEASFLASSPILLVMKALVDAFSGKGAEGGAPPPEIHALLIGIDAYAPDTGRNGTIYRPLRGCVRDILEVERFLRGAGVPAERITRLIAPNPGGPGSELPQPPESRPTYDNLVSAWQRVMATARKGDVVYIHYSGHGGRSATLFPAFKSNGLDESIAPCDINQPTGRYLRDIEIAVLLKQMAQRELLTTLVLDSCYAGSATRGEDVQARRGDTDDFQPRASESADNSAVASRADLESMARHLASTPRGLDETWRIDPGGAASSLVTVLAACRPHESSFEYAVDGTHRHGALTYFWLDTLRQRGAAMTYRTAYRQTFARVHALFRDQSPVLCGASDRRVLGAATLAQPASIAILEVDGDHVTLAAGASGLLAVGTRLAVLPPELLPELADLPAMPQVEVTSVDATTARAHVVADFGDGWLPITLGAQAVVVSFAPTMRREVRWAPSRLASRAELAARAELESEIAADTSHAIGLATTDSAHYQVAVEGSRFAILDPAGSRLPNLRPEVGATEPSAARTLKNRLVHLARFHNVQELTNTDPNSPLAGKLELSLHLADGGQASRAALPIQPIVPCNTELYLKIRNRSTRPLSIAVFDLAADWGIEYVNRGTPLTLDSGTFVDLKLVTSLPPGYEQATDVLKVIGTLEHADFEWLTLRPLDQLHSGSALTEPKRQTRAPKGPFEELMALMHEPSHGQRKVALAASPTFGWTEAQIGLVVQR